MQSFSTPSQPLRLFTSATLQDAFFRPCCYAINYVVSNTTNVIIRYLKRYHALGSSVRIGKGSRDLPALWPCRGGARGVAAGFDPQPETSGRCSWRATV